MGPKGASPVKLEHLFIIQAVSNFVNGWALVLAPKLYMSLFGVSPGAVATYMTRAYGVAYLGYSFVAWFARNAPDSEARRAMVLGFCLSGLIGFVVILVGQLSGVINALGWMVVVLYLALLGIGYGCFYFVKPKSASYLCPNARRAAG